MSKPAACLSSSSSFSFSKFNDVLSNPEHRWHPRLEFDWSAVAPCDDAERAAVQELAERLAWGFMGDLLRRLAHFIVHGSVCEPHGPDALGASRTGDLAAKSAENTKKGKVARSKVEGMGIRAAVFGWMVLRDLGRLSQTELAVFLNRKHKQSIGREVSRFRDVFGFVGEHAQDELARASCRARERRKGLVNGSAFKRFLGEAVAALPECGAEPDGPDALGAGSTGQCVASEGGAA